MSGWDSGWGNGGGSSSGGWGSDAGWGSGGSSGTSGGGWGNSDSIEVPTDAENDKVLSDVGGMDNKIDEDEMIGALEDLGISENGRVTKDQFTDFLGRLGFSDEDASKIADGVGEIDDNFTGADMLAEIGKFAGDDGEIDKSELEKHNQALADLGKDSGGWGD